MGELLDLVQLAGLEQRFPAQLSGGQRQRVALARALAVEPRVLLLDEPFGALDAKVRKDLRRWLRDVHERTGQTTVFVTHDQDEALELADRVAILNDGRLEQIGTPDEIHDDPGLAVRHVLRRGDQPSAGERRGWAGLFCGPQAQRPGRGGRGRPWRSVRAALGSAAQGEEQADLAGTIRACVGLALRGGPR